MKKKYLIFSLLIVSLNLFATDYDDMKLLLEKGLISNEEYKILSDGNYAENGEFFYSLSINGSLKSKIYEVIFKKNKAYFPIYSFFECINFKNFEEKDNRKIFLLGENLKKVELDLKNNYIVNGEESLDIKDKFILKKDEIFLEEEIFRKIFLNYLNINTELQKLNMTLSFSSPEEIYLRINTTQKLIDKQNNVNELIYTNTPKMFELGYLRVNANETFNKDIKDGNGFKKDWTAELEYQGSLLYGEITTNYDLKTHSLAEATLRYDEIYTNHMLEISNYEVGESGAREWGLSFRKDKGYYINGNKNYIIRENVPIGSRVELLYLDTVIDVQNAEIGMVEFNRSEIKADREYKLRIYTEDGKIIEKIINTTSNYNQQNKGEFEYDFSIREKHDIKRYDINSNIYYGLSDNLTLGFGYDRNPELINRKYLYLDKGKTELIYSSILYSMPYTLKIGGDKVFNDIKYDVTGKNRKDDYSIDFLGQIDIKKLRLKAEQTKYGKYYENKLEKKFNVRYSPINSLDLEYEIEKIEKYKTLFEDKVMEKNQSISIDYSKSINNFLITGEYQKYIDDNKDDNEYGLNIYYNGWRSITTRLENKWINNGKDYEVAFSLFNNGNNAIDYSFEARYSEKEKESLTFRFTMSLDNWFNFESFIDKKGNQEYKLGIDRIIDLKNPKERIETLDSSRVKVVTFVDTNNNNIMDKDEERVGKVEVNIGNKKVITNSNGEGYLYGIPNEVLYDLNPKIKKPNFLLGNNKIKIKGKTSSTISAYIPLKPMVSLTGIVNIDKELGKTDLEKMVIYDEILVQVKDLNGKVIDTAIPDNTGIFEISGLLPKQYFIEVQYIGVSYDIKSVSEVVQLSYVNNEIENKVFISFNEKEIKMEGEKND